MVRRKSLADARSSIRHASITAAVLAAAIGGVACSGTGPGKSAKSGGDTAAPERQAARSCAVTSNVGDFRPRARAGGAVVLADHGADTVAIVADGDERGIHIVDVDTGKTLSTTPVDGIPSQVAMLDDGRVVAALRDRSKLVVLEPSKEDRPMTELCRANTATEPVALTVAPDGKMLYAVNGWGASLAGYDTAELKLKSSVPVAREPREVIISSDSKRAFIAHAVGAKASVVELADKKVRVLHTSERSDHDIEQTRNEIRALQKLDGTPSQIAGLLRERDAKLEKEEFGNRRTACQSFALARSTAPTDRIFLPQVLVDPGDPFSQTVGYGGENITTEVANVAVLDASSGTAIETSRRVDQEQVFSDPRNPSEHCILPRSAAVHDGSHTLLVGCFGTDVVVAYDSLSPDPVRTEKQRWRVASGPRGIAVDEDAKRAVVWSQFDRTLNVIDLTSAEISLEGDSDEAVRHIEIPSVPERQLSIELLLGRSLFHSTDDARIARDGRSCASCHPDGREDGLVWATPNGPRRTKLLAGGLKHTAPFSWDGDAPKLEHHIKETFERLNGAGGLRSIELRALVTYMRALPAPPKRQAKKASLVARGQEIFTSEQAGCASCHSGDAFTDGKSHDVKSQTEADRKAAFDTPSLNFLAGRAPYYHDGRFKSLRELVTKVDGSMGHTKHLEKADVDALVAYLETL